MCQGCLRRLILGSGSWFSMLRMSRRLSLICRKTLSVMGFIMWILGYVWKNIFVLSCLRHMWLEARTFAFQCSPDLLLFWWWQLIPWRIGFRASIGEWYFDENVATFFGVDSCGWMVQWSDFDNLQETTKKLFFWLSVGRMPLVWAYLAKEDHGDKQNRWTDAPSVARLHAKMLGQCT
jgi:hypothetical protein